MSKAIVTFGVGPHEELLSIALPSFKAFADLHGYDLLVVDGIEPKKPAAWYKTVVILEALKEYEEVLWLGADLVIVNGINDISVPDGAWQAMVFHHTGDGEVPNTEVWYNRREMIPTLEQMWEMSDNVGWANAPWWEQSALMHLMGYNECVRPTYLKEKTEVYNHTHVLDSNWNVHRWDKPEPKHPLIQHATMWPDRAAIMREWADQASEEWMYN